VVGKQKRIRLVEASVNRSRLPADGIIIYVHLTEPINSIEEMDDLGLDFVDRPRRLSVKQLIKLIQRLDDSGF